MEDVIGFQRRMQAAAAKGLRWQRVTVALWGIAWINWFLFFAIGGCLGGDALNTLPSRDGFALNSHGHLTPVSETVWVGSLFYGGATILLTPFVVLLGVITGGLLRFRGERSNVNSAPFWVFAIFVIGWEWSNGTSAYRSATDWLHLRHARVAESRRQPADVRPTAGVLPQPSSSLRHLNASSPAYCQSDSACRTDARNWHSRDRPPGILDGSRLP